MKRVLTFCLVCFSLLVTLSSSRAIQPSYVPPTSSAPLLAGIDWANAQSVGTRFRARFNECDGNNTCDGTKLKYGCSDDKNSNTALRRFPNGTIFFDAKMGLDTDGSPYSKKAHVEDRTAQPCTSFRYSIPSSPCVDSDKVPYIVIPLGGFAKDLGVKVGDIAAVIYKDKLSYALVADQGPQCKIGEGSIQLHEELGHKVCLARDTNGECIEVKNVSITKEVLYFVFPNSKIKNLTPENAKAKIAEEGKKLFSLLGRR